LCRSENLSALPVESDGFYALCAAVDSEKNHWRRDGLRLENYALARGHKELLMQSQTIPSSLLVFLADSIWSPGRIPNEINFARLNLPGRIDIMRSGHSNSPTLADTPRQ
jgi:hypothetical protein